MLYSGLHRQPVHVSQNLCSVSTVSTGFREGIHVLRYAIKELTRRKSRSLLTIFGIVVCTALLSSVLCISRAMRNAARQPFESANADLVVQRELAECPFALVKHAGKLGGIPVQDIEKIRSLPGVEVATGVLELWSVSGRDEKDRTVVTGVEPQYQKQIGPTMQSNKCCTLTDHRAGGRYLSFTDTHTCLIEKPYADRYQLKLGDKITLAGESFRIVGTVQASAAARIAAGEVYVPLKDAQNLLGEGDVVNAVFVRAKNQETAAAIDKSLRNIIQVDAAAREKLVITTDSNVMSSVAGMALLAESATRWVAGIVVLVVFLLVVKSSLSSVSERMREIGTLKAVGWLDRHVAKLLAMESALLGLVGGAAGTLVGGGAAWAYTSVTRLRLPSLLNSYPACAKTPPPVDLKLSLEGCTPMIAGAFAVALLIGVLAGYFAARRATQLPPAEALRRV
jgi:putative ABC transport system permease protein